MSKRIDQCDQCDQWKPPRAYGQGGDAEDGIVRRRCGDEGLHLN